MDEPVTGALHDRGWLRTVLIAGNTGGLRRPRRGGTSKYAVGIFDGEIRLGGVPTYPVSDVILVPFPLCFPMNTRILGSRETWNPRGHPPLSVGSYECFCRSVAVGFEFSGLFGALECVTFGKFYFYLECICMFYLENFYYCYFFFFFLRTLGNL